MDEHDRKTTTEREGYRARDLVWAFLGGAAAGVVAALLTAPRSGPELRARIRDRVRDERDRVSHLPEALRAATDAAAEAFRAALATSNRPTHQG
jgi:gas vesicle protein